MCGLSRLWSVEMRNGEVKRGNLLLLLLLCAGRELALRI